MPGTATATARTNHGPRLPAIRGRLVWLLILLVAGGFLALQMGRQVYANWAIGQEAERIRAEIDQGLVDNEALRERLEYLRSEAFVSQEVRRLFNLGGAGEQVLIIPPGAAAPPPASVGTDASAPPPLLEQWLGVFFSS